MSDLQPSSADELAGVLADAASRRRPISLLGRNTKRLMGGPLAEEAAVISTARLCSLKQYEPGDLTVSVEAGMPFAELRSILARNGQMLAIDPPFAADATVGGIVSSNGSGPLRRAFGTMRDLVIGMTFATLEGKLVSSGGMVVKNVAGLDMGKLMIGSFGTLAAIASINFRVHSLPEETRTFLFSAPALDQILEKRDALTNSSLQPLALDLLSPAASARLSRRGYLLLLRAGGSAAVLSRYNRDLNAEEALTGPDEREAWKLIREFTPDFFRRQTGLVLRVSTPVQNLRPLLRLVSGPSVTRASSGVTYIYLSSWASASSILKAVASENWSAVVEYAPDDVRRSQQLWYEPASVPRGNSFEIMKRIKHMFDPEPS